MRTRVPSDLVELYYDNQRIHLAISDPVPDTLPKFHLKVGIFFRYYDSIIGVYDEALQLGKSPFYIYFSFPITYGDVMFSLLKKDWIKFSRDDLKDESVFRGKSLWESFLHIIHDFSEERLKELCQGVRVSKIASLCALQYFWYLYLRICKYTKLSYEPDILRYMVKKYGSFFYNREHSYLDFANYLVYTYFPRSIDMGGLLPEPFLYTHLQFFKEIPFKELRLLGSNYYHETGAFDTVVGYTLSPNDRLAISYGFKYLYF